MLVPPDFTVLIMFEYGFIEIKCLTFDYERDKAIILVRFPRNFVAGGFISAACAAAVLLAAPAASTGLLARIRSGRTRTRAAGFRRPSKNELAIRCVLE